MDKKWTGLTEAASILEAVVAREVIGEGKGYSGAHLERLTLNDGRVFVLKKISADFDFTMRLSKDRGRAATLWTKGILKRLPAGVDPAIVTAEPEGDGWILIMRDVQEALVAGDRMLTRPESIRIIRAMVEVHKQFRGEWIEDLCDLDVFYSLMTPAAMRPLSSENIEIANWVLKGWEKFGELAPADVAEIIFAIHEFPALLTQQLSQHEMTMVHGDLYIENIGFYQDRVVMIDWSLATQAPSAVDFVTFLAMNGHRMEAPEEKWIDTFRHYSLPDHDERALRLALIGGLVQYGWRMALFMTDWAGYGERSQVEASFQWWLEETRQGMKRGLLL